MAHHHRPSPIALEPLEIRTHLSATNDPQYLLQYALANTNVPAAWAANTGTPATIVADIDTGADYTHQDLYSNIWINQAEIPRPIKSKLKDIDADGIISFYDLNGRKNRPFVVDFNKNGYIDAGDLLNPVEKGGWEDGINGKSNRNDIYTDDIVGWDFAENDNTPFDDLGNDGHGTHTVGIIGAQGNNAIGISGVAQKVSLMILRIFDDAGNCISDARIAAAIRYSADNKARISNNSWGGADGYDGDVLYKAIKYAGIRGQLFVTSAGNDGRNLDSFARDYPAQYSLDNIVAVAATTADGTLASWSDYGSTQVDIAAPGDSIRSTLPHNRYGKLSGTSMATAMVSGAAALVLSANPTLTAAQVKQRLIDGADESTSLNTLTVSDGQLNVNNAVLGLPGLDVPDTPAVIPAQPHGRPLPPWRHWWPHARAPRPAGFRRA